MGFISFDARFCYSSATYLNFLTMHRGTGVIKKGMDWIPHWNISDTVKKTCMCLDEDGEM